jgi:hypothetical protein
MGRATRCSRSWAEMRECCLLVPGESTSWLATRICVTRTTLPDHSFGDLDRVVICSDLVLWCVNARAVTAAVQKLKTLEQHAPRLREKVRIVWMLDFEPPAPPYSPELCELAAGDSKTLLRPANA